MKWFINLPQWLRLLIVLPVVSVLFLAVWLMVKKKDAGEAVWDPQGKHWTEVPLKVSWDTDYWENYNNSIRKAIADFNSQVGCKIFASGSGDVSIVSAQGTPCGSMKALVANPGHEAQTYLCSDGKAEIHVYVPGDVTHMYVVILHELTHVVGLSHDGVYPLETPPAMFVPITASNAGEHSVRLGQGVMLPALSDKDEKALNERYCR